MTTQEAYEMMRTYLTRPGAQRAFDDVCRYETRIGGVTQRCAVGCLLVPNTLAAQIEIENESDFDDTMWGRNVPLRDFCGNIEAVYQAGYALPELEDVDQEFLANAQAVHDNIENWADGKFNVERLDKLAERFGLTVVTKRAPREVVVG